MEILILGAGVIGLSSAYYLRRAGHHVTVVDRNAAVAHETSYGNGGQLSYSYVAPLAGPGVLSKLPGWLCRGDSPVRFRPSASLDQWRWCAEFVRACTQAQSDRTTRQLLALSFLSRTLMHQMVRDEPSLDFNYVRSGKLVLHRDAHAFDAATALLEFQRTLGCEQQAFDANACVKLEPSLEHLRDRLAGGIYTESEDTADCYRFCRSLEALLVERGVQFRLRTNIDALHRTADGRVVAQSGGKPLAADCIVLAAGAASPRLLKPLGIRAPIYPLKGYSLTIPTRATSIAPRLSVTDFSRKIVYARLGDRLRVAGMADLTGYSLTPDPRRLATLRKETAEMFPHAGDHSAAVEWTGLRPTTPRGTPILGPTPYPNLWLNVGHGALGFTLATGSAQLLADWIDGRDGQIDRGTFALHG
ncbi:D-amino acid dehydrogenase [Paraburkholderia rhizosphaerae]|uniref:D-amino acid dehydrogenase small subunit n=1 Tax=Paraburkholderia rhizosphaerae TaxID=480658 RepID=A0A4V3HDX5_9BURK|nr:D-amino acid dehydrogenase [Paraburkholderia rhizosphaerae]TDY42764.1 D-amino acid dehydrogenase small subunit [Paraburkholderia rhizosphaerae]